MRFKDLRPNVTKFLQLADNIDSFELALIAAYLLHFAPLNCLEALLHEVNTVSPSKFVRGFDVHTRVVYEVTLGWVGYVRLLQGLKICLAK